MIINRLKLFKIINMVSVVAWKMWFISNIDQFKCRGKGI